MSLSVIVPVRPLRCVAVYLQSSRAGVTGVRRLEICSKYPVTQVAATTRSYTLQGRQRAGKNYISHRAE